MVCLSSSSPRAATLVRRGSRLAGRLNTDWFVVFVETPRESPEQIDAEAQRHLLANIEKARELGAEVVRLQARDPVDGDPRLRALAQRGPHRRRALAPAALAAAPRAFRADAPGRVRQRARRARRLADEEGGAP